MRSPAGGASSPAARGGASPPPAAAGGSAPRGRGKSGGGLAPPPPPAAPLRAGVSSFGFGGINCHVALEGADVSTKRLRALGARERRLSSSAQDVELFAWAAPDVSALLGALGPVSERARGMSWAELADLS